jgi:hypothetical protein
MNLDVGGTITHLLTFLGGGGVGYWARLRFDERLARHGRIEPAQRALLSALHDVQQSASIGGWLEHGGGSPPGVNQLEQPHRRLAEILGVHKAALMAERRPRWALWQSDGNTIVNGAVVLLRDIQEVQFQRQEHPKFLKPYRHEQAETHGVQIERLEKAIVTRARKLGDAIGRLA